MDLDIELSPQSGELGPQHNRQGQTDTREVVTELEIGRSNFVTIRVRTVQYGIYKGQTAALIVLDFILRSPAGPRRIRDFNVKVAFSNRIGGNDISTPRVLFLAPEDDTGRMVAAEHPSEIINSIASITGWKTGSGGRTDNVVVWDASESTDKGKRTAYQYNGVIIVKHQPSEPFQADFNLYVNCGKLSTVRRVFEYIPLFGGTGKDDPLLFDPSKPFGVQYHDVEDLSNIAQDELVYASKYEAERAIERTTLQLRSLKEDNKQSKEKTTGMTIRVTNIPSHFSSTNIQQILDDSGYGPTTILSLAPDITFSGQEASQVATVISSSMSEAFGRLHSSYIKRVQYEDDRIGKGHIFLDRAFLGMTTLHDPDVVRPGSCLVDLVAVHGLNGHPFGSWRAKDDLMWLRDGLPQYLTKTRVMIYGHNTLLYRSTSFADMMDHGKTLLQSINLARPGTTRKRPLIVLGQSLGGLLIKQAIVYDSRVDSHLRTMTDSLRGMLLLGTPHRGLPISHLLAMVESQPNEDFIHSLEEESPALRALHQDFIHAVNGKHFAIYSWYETHESPTAQRTGESFKMTGPPARFVSQSSATNAVPWELTSDQYPMHRTHSAMAKLEEGSNEYKLIIRQLSDLERLITSEASLDRD